MVDKRICMDSKFSITNKMLNFIIEISQLTAQLSIEQDITLHLRKENRIRSIQSSLAIEQNTLSIEQVTEIINGKAVFGPPKEIQEVKNAYSAYERVFQMNPYSIDDFLQAHSLMTHDLVEESGHFRTKDVGVFDSQGKVGHMGTRPFFVYDLIQELFSWARQDSIPDLIKSCIVHFEIEIIHPFSDGNGRMGRLWQTLILSKWNKVFEWIPIETIVYKNQQKYYEMLEIGNKTNDASAFIEFMLETILETMKEFMENEQGSHQFNKLLNPIKGELREKEILFFQKIYPYLQEHENISTTKASELTSLPIGTVRRYLLKLVDLKILIPKGENKNRTYHLRSFN